MCWSGTMGSVLLYQLMVYSGEPSTVQVKNSVLLMPVFRFLGDKVTRSGSEGRKHVVCYNTDVEKNFKRYFFFLLVDTFSVFMVY